MLLGRHEYKLNKLAWKLLFFHIAFGPTKNQKNGSKFQEPDKSTKKNYLNHIA